MRRVRALCVLLLVVSAAAMGNAIRQSSHPWGANDFSRWSTVRALGNWGDYKVGKRIDRPDGTYEDFKPEDTVDLMLHPETGFFYSSKPPLLSTVVSYPYRAIHAVLGWDTMARDADYLRVALVLFNLLPMLLYLGLLAWLLLGLGIDPVNVVLIVACASLGTFATRFVAALTNHVPATVGAGLAWCFVLRALKRHEEQGAVRAFDLMAAGLFAGGAAALEIPALILPVALGLLFGRLGGLRGVVLFGIPAALPMVAFLAVNQQVFSDPFFFYRSSRSAWMHYPGSYWENPTGWDVLHDHGSLSHQLEYVFNFEIGHHGLFSLTPIFILAWAGLVRRAWPGVRPAVALLAPVPVLFVLLWAARFSFYTLDIHLFIVLSTVSVLVAGVMGRGLSSSSSMGLLSRATIGSSVIVLCFYFTMTNNYGGTAAGPRWFMWLSPLWLLGLAWVELSNRWIKGLAGVMFGLSVVSVWPHPPNPWIDPWIYRLIIGL